MREIKFRIWDIKSKRWAKMFNIDLLDIPKFDIAEINQYTGLKDMRGKGIYEGDILFESFGEEYFKVVFEDGSFTVETEEYSLSLSEYAHICEVVGNIYENPELIKEWDDEILKTVKNLCTEENVKTYKDIKRYGIRDLADVLKFPHYKRDEENKLYQDYLHKKPEVGRNFVTYLDEMYNIGVEYYKKEHSRVGFEKLEDIPENLKKSDNEVLVLKNTILRGIKDTDLINITTNIVLSKEKIKNVFKRNNEDNPLLIDKFIEENTKDIEVLEAEKSELIKNKIYFSEIDRVYKSKNKKQK